jgi:hypothetical protein
VRDVTMRRPLAPRIIDADREAHQAVVATSGDKPIRIDLLDAV